MLWIIFWDHLVQKTVSEVLKRGIFLILHFVLQAGGLQPPPAYAIEYIIIQALNRHGSVP